MNDSWLCAMETLAHNFPERPGLQVSYRRYRLLQYQATMREAGWSGAGTVLRHARWWELFFYAPAVGAYALAYVLPRRFRLRAQEAIRAALSAYPRFDAKRRTVAYRDILEAARNVKPA